LKIEESVEKGNIIQPHVSESRQKKSASVLTDRNLEFFKLKKEKTNNVDFVVFPFKHHLVVMISTS